MQKDLMSNVDDRVGMNIQAISTNTTTSGAIIDTAGYESLVFVVQSGTLTDGTYTIALQEGDNAALSDAATVASANLIGSLPVFAATDDNVTKRIGFVTTKRYARLQIVSTGVTTGGTLGCVAVLGDPATAPVAQ